MPWLATLGKRNFDHVVVARRHRRREHCLRLLEQLGPEVARREVREREQPDAGGGVRSPPPAARSNGVSPRRGRAPPRRTSPRGRARPRPRRARWTVSTGAVSPVITMRRPRRAVPITASGVTTAPSASVTDSPRCSAPRSGPNGIPSASAASASNSPGPVGLIDGIADRGDAVVQRERRGSGSRRARAPRPAAPRSSPAGTGPCRTRGGDRRTARAARAGRRR